MNTDGTNVVRLTDSAARDTDPAWSPDGRRIAFTSERQGMADVFVLDASGSDPVRLTTTGGRHPAWSPDGNTLAYTAPLCSWYSYSCYATIYFRAPAGLLMHFALAVGERPAWSPDGRKIAYDAFRCDFYYITCEPIGIEIARVDGTDIIGGAIGYRPAWRP